MSDERPVVVLSVGTDHHPFDRAVDWLDDWLAAHPEVRGRAQVGESHPARNAESTPLLDPAELDEAMAGAVAVVCHGGPATIVAARRSGHLPVVVPRDPARGEHVDGHQQRFSRWMAERGQIVVAATRAELGEHLDRALADPDAYRTDPSGLATEATARRFGELVDALLGDEPGGRT